MSLSSQQADDLYFEELIQDGITAIKCGNRGEGRRILERATCIKTIDARPWLWLSATTDDPQEQRIFLERAVAADPSNVAAVRGLAMLAGKLSPTPPPPQAPAPRPAGPLDASAQTFLCPKCGGRMRFDLGHQSLRCEYCGHTQAGDQRLAADSAETAVGLVLPTSRAHRWAESQHQVSCERCGAVTLLPAGLTADRCPYCGSNRMIASAELAELVDPQVIALMKVDKETAYRRLRTWLGKGLLSPDDLLDQARGIQLRPAYYPYWTFDGTLEIPWRCEVNVGSSRSPRWESRNGVEYEFFDDVLVPGVKAQKLEEITAVEPFNLKDLVEFRPDYVAGWPALTYDRALSDASLLARERVVKKMHASMSMTVESGHERRNLSFGGGKWSGLTFKNILLPLWVATYTYQGKEYRLLVNGQTGRVGGKKPRDNLKALMVTAIGLILLGALAAGLVFLVKRLGL